MTQERPQPGEEKAEVASGGGKDGVDRIALGSGQVIALRAMLVLDVADERFDRGAAAHLGFDGRRQAAFLACGVDSGLVGVWRIVVAIPGVNEKTVDAIADHGFDFRDHGRQRVPVIGFPRQRLRMERELAAL